jgi:chemotaxis protein CheD
MSKEIEIHAAEMAVGHNDQSIKTGSIGSCIVTILYDPVSKIGGMSHSMLPTRKTPISEINIEKSPRYADEAIDLLVNQIIAAGGDKSRIQAKLVGGAKMFKHLTGDNKGIGYQNIESAKNRLQQLGIEIKKEDVGGSTGKIASVDLITGIVNVSAKM